MNTLTVILLSSVVAVLSQWDFPYNPQWENKWPGNKVKPICPPDNPYPCWEPPFWPYDEIHREIPSTGVVVGRSMIYHSWRYINVFLGIPYAKPPIREHHRRFKPPEQPDPGWGEGIRYWDASYYRPACPQEIWKLDEKFYEPRNISEDCLYLNIFSPNLTDRPNIRNRDYPVLLFIGGDDFTFGDAQLHPGHIVAKKEVLVVTFNYRIGALGFMSTLDSHAPGNYGLQDVLKVLEFIQSYIHIFRGDPTKVTIVGSGSGAAIVGLLLVTPKTQNRFRPLFHRAILMSGSDVCEWATVEPNWNFNALEYTRELGRRAGCDPDRGLSTKRMVDCLHDKHFEELVNATGEMWRRYGSQSAPFGPVVDGNFLPKTPEELRKENAFLKVPILAGLAKDEGAYLAENITKDIIGLKMSEGMDPGTFREILYKMVRERAAIKDVHEVVGAIEFEYTFWAKPDNKTAVRQNLIDLYSDMVYGWCVDALLKYHAQFDEPLYMYLFDYRSEFERLPLWMGTPHGKVVDYLFGHPFFNETLGNITGIIPDQWDWTYLDKNISVFVQDMWTNFTKYGDPTTEWTRNVTWYPFSLLNLSYLHIEEFSYMDINYRQNHYAFWREYFPTVASRWPLTTTPQPTPRPLVGYQAATWSLVGASIITVFVVVALGITLWRRTRQGDVEEKQW